jgi:hypothetical protein
VAEEAEEEAAKEAKEIYSEPSLENQLGNLMAVGWDSCSAFDLGKH